MDSPSDYPESVVSRRTFFKRAFAGCAGCGALAQGYARYIEPHWVVVEQRSLPIINLPKSLIGKRIVQLSDIHVSANVSQQFLESAVRSIESLAPDLIVLTGDFMTCHADEQVDRAVHTMSLLPQAALGAFAVLGNHDYGSSWTRQYIGDKLARGLEGIQIRVLRNEVADANGLQIVGVDDLWAGFCQPRRALENLRADQPSLALCHNPDGVDLPEWDGYRGWTLSGHTHGGQCKPPWLDPPIIPVKNKRYTFGEIQVSQGRRMYINRGLGYVRQWRFNCPPEITVFTLERDLQS